MSMTLQIILSMSIATITVFLVMLLIQARRTALSVQRLAESAAMDLHQAAGDVHAVRVKVEEAAQAAKAAIEAPTLLTQAIAGFVGGWRGGYGSRNQAEPFLEALLTGIRAAVHWFRGRSTEPPKEGRHE